MDEKGLQISPALYHELEKRIIELVLEKTDHNLSQTARFLGISRNTLKMKLRKYQLELTPALK
ncbi:MAG: hypothetical protein D6681_16575 [Calditrichaeota bacterium]|nr:MAG: hypothetical protein D6681_16575 [Calditrichota bacterium]